MAADTDKIDCAAGSGAIVTVKIRCTNGSEFLMPADLDATVKEFKSTLVGKCGVPVEKQMLIYMGRILKDAQTLESLGLKENHSIHLVCSPRAFSNSNSTAGNIEGPNTNLAVSTGIGFNQGGSGTGLPEPEPMDQQPIHDTDMNMPTIQALTFDHEFNHAISHIISDLHELTDQTDDLSRALNDTNMREMVKNNDRAMSNIDSSPGVNILRRQKREIARNTELMREMIRNNDRALSNIESSPEGFNMLRRMHETVQERLQKTTTTSGDACNLGSNPLLANQLAARAQPPNPSTSGPGTAASFSPNTNPLPNPWSNADGNSAASHVQRNMATRSNLNLDTKVRGTGRLCGTDSLRGLTRLKHLLSSLPSPLLSHIAQNLRSNPQYLNQLLASKPVLQCLVDSNPRLRRLVRNPAFPRLLVLFENMQRQSSAYPASQHSSQERGQGSSVGVPPEELYATQLAQLQEMGFIDMQANIRALIATAGDVQAAVERLLRSLDR